MQRPRRVVFYGPGDLAAGIHADRVARLVSQFDPANVPTAINDVLELHHAALYLEDGNLPRTLTAEQVQEARAKEPRIRGAILRFFSRVDDSNVDTAITGIDHEYHRALVDLLGGSKSYERCDAVRMLDALRSTGCQPRDDAHQREACASVRL